MRPRQHRVVVSKNKGLPSRPGMVPVPRNFTPNQRAPYPPDNTIPFERWYMENYLDADERERMYLPIQWTALYCNNNYGKCAKTKLHIQAFLDGLDKSKKYYTIVQYDDGILNTLKHLDIKVFAMSGPRVDYPLPLISMPHQYKFNVEKDIYASFVGRVTHPIREQMVKQLQGLDGYYISTKPHSLEEYCRILARSKYALCPRGYGQSSFRIQEAVQYDAVPVYVSDDFIWPYNKPLPIVTVLDNEINKIDSMLKFQPVTFSITPADKFLFTYQGCKKEILEELKLRSQ